ncbi:cytochrome P450 [Streptomyces daliensis]
MVPAAADISVDRRHLVSLLNRLRTPKGQAAPYPLYAELRSMGDVVPAPWDGFLVTGFDVSGQILRNRSWPVPDSSWRARQEESVRWHTPASMEMSKTLAGLNGPQHARHRRSLGRVFDRGVIDTLRPVVEQAVGELLDMLGERLHEGEADFVALVSEELPVVTVGHWLGIPAADHALVRQFTHDQVYAQELLPTKSQLALSEAASAGLRDYFTAFVRDRRRNLSDDALSGWIRTWDELEPDREAADDALQRLTMFVTIAALETAATLLSAVVWLLDANPEQREWLRAHPEKAGDAVEEVLRYDPAIHVSSRTAPEDTELCGVRIPKDSLVHVMIGAANHDPRRHQDPETFDVRRKTGHLAFGGGPHYCLGAALARLEATTLLRGLLRRFPTLRVSSPPSFFPRVAFRRMAELNVVTA